MERPPADAGPRSSRIRRVASNMGGPRDRKRIGSGTAASVSVCRRRRARVCLGRLPAPPPPRQHERRASHHPDRAPFGVSAATLGEGPGVHGGDRRTTS